MKSRRVLQVDTRAAGEHSAAYGFLARVRSLHSHWVLGGMIIAYTLFLTFGASFKYAYWGMGYDQIDYQQAIWNTTQGRFLNISHYAWTDSFLGLDFAPGLLFAVPFYMLWPSAYMLNLLQSALLALGALPVYLIARDRWANERAGLAWAATYLLYPSLQFVNMTPPWQPRTLAVLMLLWAFSFFQRQRLWPFLLAMLVAITTRTDVSLVVCAFGLYALLVRRTWQWAALPLVLGLSWFYLSTSILTPAFYLPEFTASAESGSFDPDADYADSWPGTSPQVGYYAHLGKNPVDIIKNIVTHPVEVAQLVFTREKLTYLFLMFGALLFLPLLAPKELILTAPIFAINLLSTRVFQYKISEQYQALIIPGIVIAGIYGSARLHAWLSQRLPGARPHLAGMLLAQVLLIGSINLGLRNPVISTLRHHEDPARIAVMERMAAQIPDDAAVAATSFLAPHLLPRQHLYYVPPGPMFPPLEAAEFVFIDTRAAALRGTGLVERLRSDPAWDIVDEEADLILFRQRHKR
ncbi:MAG: hypothetical protein KatS3mg057_2636 [Herpetosiphonaceae bacterium]|nr:MAG: hypothetical protein KatS3mg057_2636 [Herpetosiphonaceae bacterium]